MRALQTPELQQGYAEVFWYGKSRGNASLVMELLGKSLEDTMEACKGQMPVNSVVLVAAQAIMRIEYLHSRGIVHRDIKPENFMWGIQDKVHHLYLIDFGMCTTYFDKTHLPVKNEASLVGTARYASINTHELKTQSRRDDLEAIGHVFFYLLRGKLPWSGLKAKTDEEKYRKIGEVKKTTPITDLCKGHPPEFARYLEYSRALQWEERPDYERLHQLVRSVREQVAPPRCGRAGTSWTRSDARVTFAACRALDSLSRIPVHRCKFGWMRSPDKCSSSAFSLRSIA